MKIIQKTIIVSLLLSIVSSGNFKATDNQSQEDTIVDQPIVDQQASLQPTSISVGDIPNLFFGLTHTVVESVGQMLGYGEASQPIQALVQETITPIEEHAISMPSPVGEIDTVQSQVQDAQKSVELICKSIDEPEQFVELKEEVNYSIDDVVVQQKETSPVTSADVLTQEAKTGFQVAEPDNLQAALKYIKDLVQEAKKSMNEFQEFMQKKEISPTVIDESAAQEDVVEAEEIVEDTVPKVVQKNKTSVVETSHALEKMELSVQEMLSFAKEASSAKVDATSQTDSPHTTIFQEHAIIITGGCIAIVLGIVAALKYYKDGYVFYPSDEPEEQD